MIACLPIALLLGVAACAASGPTLGPESNSNIGPDRDAGVDPSHDDAGASNDTMRGPGRKIVPPPAGGMYIGQVEAYGGETATLESALGQRAALKFPIAGEDFESTARSGAVMMGMEDPGEGRVDFHVKRANALWNDGYVTSAGAYETAIGQGFRVTERLLRGEFDGELHKLALKFKKFGKPMFFGTTREPNGAGGTYKGGFGKNGDKTTEWAASEYGKGNKAAGFEMFIPPPPPDGAPDLYAGLGDPDFCDGYERLVAAQRYYYDFFVRREGIDFLTFETMGWWVPDKIVTGDEFVDRCDDFSLFIKKLDGYYDWITINWYLLPNAAAGELQDQPSAVYLDRLKAFMKIVSEAAPNKPVMLSEFGFGDDNDAQKVKDGLKALLDHYPQIAAFSLWYDAGVMKEETPEGGTVDIPFNVQVEPGTPEGEAFREIVEAHPDRFHSRVFFSDGTTN